MANLFRLSSFFVAFAILLDTCHAGGFIGYGISKYPEAPFRCPYICRQTISGCTLTCTKLKGTKKTTTPACYASNDAFLETLAYCMQSRCTDLELWEGEKYWTEMTTGSADIPAKYSYGETLKRLPPSPPNATIAMGKALNVTSKTKDHDYQMAWNTVGENESGQTATSRYAIVLITSGLLIPIVFSLLRFAPLPRSLVTKVCSYLVLPPIWGSKHRTPIGGNIGTCPTRGQSLFIFFLCALNFLLCVATYRFVPLTEQTKFKTKEQQLLTGMGNRIGHLALANLALMTLFAGRNNFLLWITKWQRATFLLFHHWVGYIVILEGAVHASVYLHIYLESLGDDDYSVENKEPYWIWGTTAVLAICLIFPLSILPVRQKAYEIFLASHRLLALLTMIGVFLHTFLQNASKGYHNWVIAAFAALGFDYLMRFIRIARNGLCMAEITVIDEDYIRVDVNGPNAEGHAFIYFPTLTWRFWESHPFSVAASVHDYLPFHTHKISGSTTPDETSDVEKGTLTQSSEKEINISPSEATRSNSSTTLPTRPSAGVTFFIRRQSGLTSLLGTRLRLPVLVESSYGSLSNVSRSPNLIAIAGGVGIVTVLPLLRTHPGRTKLYWSMRTPGLLDALSEDIKGVEREVAVGSRLDIEGILEREVGGVNGKGACVVVSGPGGMADEVRRAVVKLGKRRDAWPVKFVDESFR